MSARNLLLGLILVIFVSTVALADGGFYGSVTYKNCECSWPPNYDRVRIVRIDQVGGPWFYGVDCWGPGYSTEGGAPETFPPGRYQLVVALDENSECRKGLGGLSVVVTHGDDWQEVNLIVRGPEGQPRDGDE